MEGRARECRSLRLPGWCAHPADLTGSRREWPSGRPIIAAPGDRGGSASALRGSDGLLRVEIMGGP